ncbi:MAG: PAS domain-containing protein [Planctomycetota bacterium]
MKFADLEVFSQMPFLFWVKDKDSRYVWGNAKINKEAKQPVAGKLDADMWWKDDAPMLIEHDKQVFATGEPIFLQEHVLKSDEGDLTLNVCKWLGELDGEPHCFGISFVIDK